MNTHLFFSPHTDDETIAMAGAIVDAKESGARVVLYLVTDNQPSAKMRDAFTWYEGDLPKARLLEFREAALRLGVDEVNYTNASENVMATDRSSVVAMLRRLMVVQYDRFAAKGQVTCHTTMGDGDPHFETHASNRAHGVCDESLRQFKRSRPDARCLLHKVYVYSHPFEQRTAPIIRTLSMREGMQKLRALDAYKSDQPRIGYGYRSVPELFDAAASDNREYMEML